MRMIRRIGAKLLQTVAVLWAIYTVTFSMIVVAPGNPFQREGGRALSPLIEQALRQRYGMDSNMRFYFDYLGGVLRGDLGVSLEYRNWTCNQIIGDALPVSMTIGLIAIVIAAISGIVLGVLSAVHRGRWIDYFSQGLSALALSVPAFVIGAVLLVLFSVVWPLLPAGQWGRPIDALRPAIALSLLPMAYIMRLTRSGMLDAMSSDYVRTARAKGLPESLVIWRHALPNALLPVVSYLGPAAAWTMTGSFVVEKVFNVPGLGTHFVNGVLNRDQMLVLAVVLVYSALIVFFNMMVDIVYGFVDPRVRA